MSGRDLLYKPQAPVLVPDDEQAKKEEAQRRARLAKQVGVENPGRDLGSSEVDVPRPVHRPQDADAGQQTRREQPKPQARLRGPAHASAYFNKDTNAVRQANQGATPMRALRGAEGTLDLRKVVLPPSPYGVDAPNPERLQDASHLMGLDGEFDLDLRSLIGRQGGWTRDKGVTVEMLQQRIAQFEQMVADRRHALARMAQRSAEQAAAQSSTVKLAMEAEGRALDQIADLETEGAQVVERSLSRAVAMHRRIAKILGFKLS